MNAAPRHWRELAALVPDWNASPRVHAFVTGRRGGVSTGAWGRDGEQAGGLNLGAACGDDPRAVASNRGRLAELLPSAPVWLRQVHGAGVHVVAEAAAGNFVAAQSVGTAGAASTSVEAGSTPGANATITADAAVTARPGAVLAVLTADCLPVFIADRRGRAVGVAHAGWRGLAGGVLENTVAAVRALLPADAPLQAWLGPAIGPGAFEVGRDVLDAFCDVDPACREAFVPGLREGKWFADLYRLAARRLGIAGVDEISGGGFCTFSDRERFWSYRREPRSGRMASLIWIEADSAPSA